MIHQVRVGVLGTGRLWRRRYRPALATLGERYRVIVIGDAVPARAEREAHRLGCRVAAGPTDLLADPDLDAVLLLDPGWYGLWPLRFASRRGLPVFCAASLAGDDAHADQLLAEVSAARLPVLVELAPPLHEATTRLRELLAGPLGPPHWVECVSDQPPRRPGHEDSFGPDLLPLLDLGVGLLDALPVRVRAADVGSSAGLSSLTLTVADGRSFHVVRRRYLGARPRVRLTVASEHGSAEIDLPTLVTWHGADGSHRHRVARCRPLGVRLLEQFHDTVTSGTPPIPSLASAYRALGWVRAAVRSSLTGATVSLTEAPNAPSDRDADSSAAQPRV